MKNVVAGLQVFLEKLDYYRDQALFIFIKPYWPRVILPNYLTAVRIFIGITLFILLFIFGIESKTLILSLFIIGALTDLFDGSVARGTNKVTELGAMLDSTADRILILPIAVYSLYRHHRLLLFIFIAIEVINVLTSLYYKSKEMYLDSNIFGKTTMVLLCFFFIAVLAVWPNYPPQFFINILWLAVITAFANIFIKISEVSSLKKRV